MLAKETFGVGDAPVLSELEKSKSIDLADPCSKEDFDKLRTLLQDKLLPYEVGDVKSEMKTTTTH